MFIFRNCRDELGMSTYGNPIMHHDARVLFAEGGVQ